MDTTTIRIKQPTDDERALINILSVEERLAVLIEAARSKAQKLSKAK
jgi:hypothetical protein